MALVCQTPGSSAPTTTGAQRAGLLPASLTGRQRVLGRIGARCRSSTSALQLEQQWRSQRAAARRGGGAAAGAAAEGSSGSSGSSDECTGDDAWEQRFLHALLLAFFASQNRSLFAAKCLVEVAIEIYREGLTLDDVAVLLSLANLQKGGKLLSPVDEDVLLSWLAVVMLALEMVGVPLPPQVEERRRRSQQEGLTSDTNRARMGLKGFVRVAVDQFLAGTDLYRLQLQQSMGGQAGEGEAAGPSPAVQVLQQNTRLVIIALEVVRSMGLPTEVPLVQAQPPSSAEDEAEQQPQQQPSVGATSDEAGAQQQTAAHMSAVPGFALAFDPARLAKSDAAAQQRAAAVRLLISFNGAAMGWLYPAWDFVEQCTECYAKGWTCDDVYAKLNDEEFAQSGGMLISIARLPSSSNVSALMLARWLSLCYMTLAQLRVVFPGATQQDGWAWVTGSAAAHDGADDTTLEAYGLADFVHHRIRNEEERERGLAAIAGSGGSGSSGGSGPQEGVEPAVEGVLLRPALDERPQEGFLVSVEDPRLLSTSPTALVMSQQISLVQMTRQLVLQERATGRLAHGS